MGFYPANTIQLALQSVSGGFMRGWVYAMTMGFAVGCGLKELDLDSDSTEGGAVAVDEDTGTTNAPRSLTDDTGTSSPMELDDDESSDADEGVDDPFDTADEADIDDIEDDGGAASDDGAMGGTEEGVDADDGPPAHGKAPTALCSVTPSPIVAALDTTDWVGSESYDIFGYDLTYDWTLIVAPEGSAATMPEGEADRLAFTPDIAGTYVGRLIVTNSRGLESEPCEVRLTATPPDRPNAVCTVEPTPIRPLLDAADWIGNESSDPNGLTLIEYEWTLTEVPAGSAAVMPEGDADRLDFVPDLEGAYVGQLIVTNSAGVPSIPCTTTLNVSPNRPVAECDVAPNPVRPLLDSADWIGEDSYDPDGLGLTYDWSLIDQPPGSTATMPFGDANRLGFVPDLAGDYVGRLVVTSAAGVPSEPCIARLNAVPSENLWVEMFWTHSGDDMDLHLLAPGGTLRSDRDCYYSNCAYSSLDWGTVGDSSDDPALDLDDISGTGPENINIEAPEDGVFTVVVHDYPGSVYSGGNPVTVNIYLDGILEWTDTRSIDVEDSYTNFAEINTITGTVTGL